MLHSRSSRAYIQNKKLAFPYLGKASFYFVNGTGSGVHSRRALAR